jgi:perosamine synthetase
VVEGLELPCADADGDRRSWFVYVVLVPPGVDRDAAIEGLRARGVDSKPYLPAIHLLSFYRERFGHRPGELPECEEVSARALALPFFPALSDGQVERVVTALAEVLEELRRRPDAARPSAAGASPASGAAPPQS